MIWTVGIAAAAIAGYWAACYLTGENLAATWWDEWRLSRRSLSELDAACASNPRDSGLVVTLTTIPSRIEALAPTLKSLLRQTARPREIRLCVPQWSERERRAYAVPAWLSVLRSVTLVRCADEGPATKFLSTLRAVPADQPVAVVDDDRVYHPRLLESFAALLARSPDEAISAAGWNVPADLVDRPTTLGARLAGAPHVPVRANQVARPTRVDIVQGLHGYVVQPRFFDLRALGDFSTVPAAVRWVDDVWISAQCTAPKRVHPMPLAFTDYKPWAGWRRFNATSLGANVNRAADHAQRGNSIALRALHSRFAPRSDGARR